MQGGLVEHVHRKLMSKCNPIRRPNRNHSYGDSRCHISVFVAHILMRVPHIRVKYIKLVLYVQIVLITTKGGMHVPNVDC